MKNSKIHPKYNIEDLSKRDSTLTKQTNFSEEELRAQTNTLNISSLQLNRYTCPICYCASNQFYCIGNCEHKFCRLCCFAYINQQINSNKQIICPNQSCLQCFYIQINPNDKHSSYFFRILQEKQKKKILKYNNKIKQLKKTLKCTQCIYSHQDQSIKVQMCQLCQQQQLNLPKNIKKCSKCERLLEKFKGCNHLKCQCGYQFCFICMQTWQEDHICQDRIAVREGLPGFLCNFLKVLLGIPIIVFLSIIWIFFVITICLVSGALGGFIVFINVLEKMSKTDINDCLKFIFLICWVCLLPIIWVICAIFGFITPLINICYHQKLIMDIDIIKSITNKIFSCIKLYMAL